MATCGRLALFKIWKLIRVFFLNKISEHVGVCRRRINSFICISGRFGVWVSVWYGIYTTQAAYIIIYLHSNNEIYVHMHSNNFQHRIYQNMRDNMHFAFKLIAITFVICLLFMHLQKWSLVYTIYEYRYVSPFNVLFVGTFLIFAFSYFSLI